MFKRQFHSLFRKGTAACVLCVALMMVITPQAIAKEPGPPPHALLNRPYWVDPGPKFGTKAIVCKGVALLYYENCPNPINPAYPPGPGWCNDHIFSIGLIETPDDVKGFVHLHFSNEHDLRFEITGYDDDIYYQDYLTDIGSLGAFTTDDQDTTLVIAADDVYPIGPYLSKIYEFNPTYEGGIRIHLIESVDYYNEVKVGVGVDTSGPFEYE